jgi:hypothetical protein
MKNITNLTWILNGGHKYFSRSDIKIKINLKFS